MDQTRGCRVYNQLPSVFRPLRAAARMNQHAATEKRKLNPISITMIKWSHHVGEWPIAKCGNADTCSCEPAFAAHSKWCIPLCKSKRATHILTSLNPFSGAHAHKYMPKYTQRHKEPIEPSRGLMLGRVGLDSCHNEASAPPFYYDIQASWPRYTWMPPLIEAFY